MTALDRRPLAAREVRPEHDEELLRRQIATAGNGIDRLVYGVLRRWRSRPQENQKPMLCCAGIREIEALPEPIQVRMRQQSFVLQAANHDSG